MVRPATLLRFHQALIRRKYQALFSSGKRSKPGPKGPSDDLVRAIVALKEKNSRFGCPRIALIISKTFGVKIDKDVVRRVLAKHYRPKSGGSGPSWLTFLGHAKDSLWSVDLFMCESITLTTYWVMVVIDQYTRRIIGFGVQRGAVDGPQRCRMFNDSIAGMGTSKRLSPDHDPLFESQRWLANLRVLCIDEVKTVAYVPISHPFVERLIGTVRREYLDHLMFWNSPDRTKKLLMLRSYYNGERARQSHDGKTPDEVVESLTPVPADLHNFSWKSTCNGLVALPKAA